MNSLLHGYSASLDDGSVAYMLREEVDLPSGQVEVCIPWRGMAWHGMEWRRSTCRGSHHTIRPVPSRRESLPPFELMSRGMHEAKQTIIHACIQASIHAYKHTSKSKGMG